MVGAITEALELLLTALLLSGDVHGRVRHRAPRA